MAVWIARVSGEHRTTLGVGERPSIDCRALRTRACPLGDRLVWGKTSTSTTSRAAVEGRQVMRNRDKRKRRQGRRGGGGGVPRVVSLDRAQLEKKKRLESCKAEVAQGKHSYDTVGR